MYVYAHSWSPNDGNRNQQNSQLLSLFPLQHALILVSNPIHQYNIFLLASFFFRWVKEISKTNSLEALSLYMPHLRSYVCI